MQEESGVKASEGYLNPEEEPITGLRRTTLTAMLLALYLAVDILPSPIPPPFSGLMKFTAFPSLLAGFIVGPWAGAIVGALGDLLHYALHPRGAYFPGFALTGAITGALPALLVGRRPRTLLRLFLAIGVVQLFTKLLIVPTILDYFFGRPWQLQVPISALEQVFHIPLYAYAVYLVLGQWNAYQRNR